MRNFVKQLDSLAGIKGENVLAMWLERLAFGALILMTLSAPHSIAATQTSWLLGMIFWVARFFITPRPKFIKTALFIPFLVFFGWTALTAIFSYAPDISIDKLRSASLFLIFFFAVNNLRTRKSVRFMAIALIFSCMVVAIWTPIERLVGRGIEIGEMEIDSPLVKAGLHSYDSLLTADGKKLKAGEDLKVMVRLIEKNKTVRVGFRRPSGWHGYCNVKKIHLLKGKTILENLGVKTWKRSRNWRSSGFYSHYATYSEVLQLIISLTFGLFIASLRRKDSSLALKNKKRHQFETFEDQNHLIETDNKRHKYRLPPFLSTLLLFFCSLTFAIALLLTVTRASQGAFLISALFIVLLNGSRKTFIVFLSTLIPIIIFGTLFMQQSRSIGFIDSNDGSTVWRQTVYKEGLELWTKNVRNFTIGVGLDSIKRFKEEWHLFDDGKLPPGHFHSTPLQLVVERGLPALFLWLWILSVYARRTIRTLFNRHENWVEKGILLGSLGGTVGFLVSGLVHYNFGDGEVVMIFYLIMAFAFGISRKHFGD